MMWGILHIKMMNHEIQIRKQKVQIKCFGKFFLMQIYSLRLLWHVVIVHYVPRRIRRVIMLRAIMLAGDQSRDKAETKPRRSRGAISPVSILNESRNLLNCVHWRIFYFMLLRPILILSILCSSSAL